MKIIKIRDYNLILKCILIIFVIINALSLKNITNCMILMLIVLVCIFSAKIIKGRYKVIIDLIQIGVLLFVSYKYTDSAVILLNITIIEVSFKYNKRSIVGIPISLGTLYLVETENLINYIFIIIFMYIHLIESNKINTMIIKLEDKSEQQRKKIYDLENTLKIEKNYSDQILYTSKLEERNKISGDLHDKIGHTITGSILQLEAIMIILQSDFTKGISGLERVIANLRNGMDEIRMTLRDIRPEQEELGINKIKLILEQKIKNTKYKYKVEYNGDLNLITPSVWRLFIECVKEVSTNTLKYAKGDLILVKLDILNSIIKLEVKDNGIGQEKVVKGIGLNNIELKAAEFNGKVILDGSNGFSVIILIPFK